MRSRPSSQRRSTSLCRLACNASVGLPLIYVNIENEKPRSINLGPPLTDLQINPSADHSPAAKQFGREPPRARRCWHRSTQSDQLFSGCFVTRFIAISWTLWQPGCFLTSNNARRCNSGMERRILGIGLGSAILRCDGLDWLYLTEQEQFGFHQQRLVQALRRPLFNALPRLTRVTKRIGSKVFFRHWPPELGPGARHGPAPETRSPAAGNGRANRIEDHHTNDHR